MQQQPQVDLTRESRTRRFKLMLSGAHAAPVATGFLVSLALFSAAMVVAQPMDMGATYRSLDAQITRATTEFEDAYAITTRSAGGALETTLYSPAGEKLAGSITSSDSFELAGVDAMAGKQRFDLPGFEVTTDWASSQLYSIWLDRQAAAEQKLAAEPSWQWQGGFLRSAGSAIGKGEVDRQRELASRALAVTTRFGRLEASSVRHLGLAALDSDPADEVSHATFSTRIIDQSTGQPLGLARWFEQDQVFSWELPGLTSGWVDEARMQQSFSFAPDLAWINIQVFAFWQMHSDLLLRQAGPQAKNTEGCDGLHWLDDSIFRPCCDEHDLCFERNGCTSSSWWVFGSSWSCIRCNLEVVFCFLTGGGGGGGGFGGGGGGGGGGIGCTRPLGGWCPPECISCVTVY